MDYKDIAAAIRLCGSESGVEKCREECAYFASGKARMCILHMTADAADAITELLSRCARLEEARERANEACAKWEDRAESAERERDAAISDLETAMAYGGTYNCQFCGNAQCLVRGGTKPCLPKWRGTKEG